MTDPKTQQLLVPMPGKLTAIWDAELADPSTEKALDTALQKVLADLKAEVQVREATLSAEYKKN